MIVLAQKQIRQAKFAAFSVLKTHIFRQTGQFSPTQFLVFLLSKWVCDKSSEWYACQLFKVSQNFIQVICFLVFFHANLLSASNFLCLGWLAWLLSGDSKSKRSQNFLESNTSKCVNALILIN